MDVGTAKPWAWERAAVRHHGIDLVEASETFTVARFVEMADQVIADATARRAPLIVTGGTPLYYKALFEGLFEGPGADAAVRAKLSTLPSDELVRRLAEVAPAAAGRVHENATKPLVPALDAPQVSERPSAARGAHG